MTNMIAVKAVLSHLSASIEANTVSRLQTHVKWQSVATLNAESGGNAEESTLVH